MRSYPIGLMKVAAVLAAVMAFTGCPDSGGVYLNTDVVVDATGSDATAGQDSSKELPSFDVIPSDTPLADGMVCRPGDTQCVGSVFLSCLGDGSDWDSANCPAGTTCTAGGCVGQGDTITPPDKDVIEPPKDTVQPPEDTVQPPNDTMQPPEDAVQPPQDTGETGCGGGPPCGEGQECCVMMGGASCVPEGQCPGPQQGCQSDKDCDPGLTCCPGNFPGAPNECKEDCGGGPPQVPTCDTDADCTGGQTCVDIMGWTALCLSECAGDEDCGQGQPCQEIGGFGYVLAMVCGCATDGDCGASLKCCNIPLINQTTCLTQCIGF